MGVAALAKVNAHQRLLVVEVERGVVSQVFVIHGVVLAHTVQLVDLLSFAVYVLESAFELLELNL